MQDEIRKILKSYIIDADCRNAAAQAIAELVERQPVDQARAMAAVIYVPHDNYYLVPNGLGSVCTVWRDDSGRLRCPGSDCRSGDNCDHIRAAELFRERQGENDG